MKRRCSRRSFLQATAAGLLTPAASIAADNAPQALDVQHFPVYAIPGRFGGWPANHGIWSWGDEILVGFSAGYYQKREGHHIDHDRPEEHVLSRSLDGGRSWTVEHPAEQHVLVGTAGMRHGTIPPGQHEPEPVDCPGGIDFTHPDFAMTCRMPNVHGGVSRLYYSYDRGHSWKGPFRLPLFGQPGIAARTDYIVNGGHDCLIFLTAGKQNQREGRPLCGRTVDGGKTWKLVGLIGPEPKGFAIMPSAVRLSGQELLAAVRCREDRDGMRRHWIEAWHSQDEGRTWSLRSIPVQEEGADNPPHMIRLADGRLCLTYGRRAAPLGMYARLSDDQGKTWTGPITLRDDGGSSDLGYPRTLQRRDGRIVTVYYFHARNETDRTIVATIWSPPKGAQ
jgi:hypothetical protein